MARKTEVGNAPEQKSLDEIRAYQMEFDKQHELFKAAEEAISFLNLTKNETRSFTIYNKENLRTYLKNPKSYESSLRNLSRFLYRVSQPYRRLVDYNAQQMDLTACTVIPNIDFTKKVRSEKTMKTYYQTCSLLEKMNMPSEIYKMLITAWIEDCAYGYVYESDKGFYIMKLDGDYCKVSSVNPDDGTLNFAFDFTFFRKNLDLLDYWDPEFQKKYNAYLNDNKLRWQELDNTRTICLKVNIEDPTMAIPPYIALFEPLIDCIDLQSIVSVKNALSIYKLLVARLETISGSDVPDDFSVDPKLALQYYNKWADSIPEEVATILSPLKIDTIEFEGTNTDKTDMVNNSVSNLFKVSGGSMVLNDDKSGASIYRAHLIADMMHALKPLLNEVENWVNRYIKLHINDAAIVKYMFTSPWMKNEKKAELINSAQYGVPVKMAVAALDGFSPLEVLSMQFLENDQLALHDAWIPLQSSFTRSADDSNNKKDSTDLTDEGAETREKEKNGM